MNYTAPLKSDLCVSVRPQFVVTFPSLSYDFGDDADLVKEYLKRVCGPSWRLDRSLQELFSACDSFNKAALEAYHAYVSHGLTSYLGLFYLSDGVPCDAHLLFTMTLMSHPESGGPIGFNCTLLAYDDQIKLSVDCVRHMQRKMQMETINQLTLREIEVLRDIANGATAKEIGEHLCISSHTVESHKQKLYKKLNVRNTAELGKLAERYGIAID